MSVNASVFSRYDRSGLTKHASIDRIALYLILKLYSNFASKKCSFTSKLVKFSSFSNEFHLITNYFWKITKINGNFQLFKFSAVQNSTFFLNYESYGNILSNNSHFYFKQGFHIN